MIGKNKIGFFKGLSNAISSLFKSSEKKNEEERDPSILPDQESNFIPGDEISTESKNSEQRGSRRKRIIHSTTPLELQSGNISGKIVRDIYRHDFYSNPEKLKAFHRYLFKRFLRLQLTIENVSDAEKQISLFGANKGDAISDAYTNNYEFASTGSIPTGTGSYPQGIAYNPVNQLFYIACKQDNSVVVYNPANNTTNKIKLNDFIAGTISPSDIAIHPTGNAYVTGEASNSVIVINTSFSVVANIPVVTRPMGITYNPVNGRIYVALFTTNKVALIQPSDNTVAVNISVGAGPMGILSHPVNGKVYVANFLSNSVTVINTDLTTTTVPNILTGPKYPVYYPITSHIYIPTEATDKVYELNSTTNTVKSINMPVGSGPVKAIYNPVNHYLYVANNAGHSFTITTQADVIATIPLSAIGSGLIYDTVNNNILVSDPNNDQVLILGPLTNGGISISEDYKEILEDIKLNPMLIKHVKWTLKDGERIYTLQIIDSKPTSNIHSKPFSLGHFYSPQASQNVLELYAFESEIIDGHISWKFKLPAKQRVTILIYYRQLRREILNK